jgi:hypothetical protein
MALVLKDRVLESSTSTGAGSFTLTGAQTGYQSFSAIGNGNTTYYTIQGKNPDGTLTGEWEVGIGTYTASSTTLSRDTVLSNSLGTTAKILFSAGAKDVFCDYPASKSVNQNADNKVIIPYTSGVTNTGSLNVGDVTAHTDSGVIAAFTASEPLYLYTSLQNTSSANTSYASYAVNDGGHTSYGELGINNSNYSYSAAGFPNNTFSAPLATFVESYGGPLAIGTWDSQKISFIVNGSVNTADAMTISAAGTITIPSLTASQAVFTDASKNLVSKAVTGTGSVVLDTNPSINGGATIDATTQAIDIATSQTTGAVTIGGTGATGAITVGRSSGVQTVNIASEANTGNKTVNIGTGNITTGVKTVNIGTGTTQTGYGATVNIGVLDTFGSQVLVNGAIALQNGTNSLNLGTFGSSGTGDINLGRSSASYLINVGGGATASGNTKTITIGGSGTNGSTTNINIGPSLSGALGTTTLRGAVTLSADTQAINIGNSQTTGTISIGSTSGTGTITVGQSTGGQTVLIGASTTGTRTIVTVSKRLDQQVILYNGTDFTNLNPVKGTRAMIDGLYDGGLYGEAISGFVGGSNCFPCFYDGSIWRFG